MDVSTVERLVELRQMEEQAREEFNKTRKIEYLQIINFCLEQRSKLATKEVPRIKEQLLRLAA